MKIILWMYKNILLATWDRILMIYDIWALKRAVREADYKSLQCNGRKFIVMKSSAFGYVNFCRKDLKNWKLKEWRNWEYCLANANYITKR